MTPSRSTSRRWRSWSRSASDGGLFSTARDQIRYARFHLGQAPAEAGTRVLATETLDRMKTPTISMHGGMLGDWVGIS
jgi:CubicO group peptidase (beta-lactamase class C family)